MRRLFSFFCASLAATTIACVSEAPDTSCEVYCKQITTACAGSDAQYTFLTGSMSAIEACNAACATFPKTMETTGNTQKCRAAQLTLVDEAKGNPAEVHTRCMEAGPFSEICGGRVANFCRYDISVCGMTAFGSQQACESAFGSVADGLDKGVNDNGVPSLNTKACYFYHLQKATEPNGTALHCRHTKVPSPVCTQ